MRPQSSQLPSPMHIDTLSINEFSNQENLHLLNPVEREELERQILIQLAEKYSSEELLITAWQNQWSYIKWGRVASVQMRLNLKNTTAELLTGN